eukprot:gene14533-biopygen624
MGLGTFSIQTRGPDPPVSQTSYGRGAAWGGDSWGGGWGGAQRPHHRGPLWSLWHPRAMPGAGTPSDSARIVGIPWGEECPGRPSRSEVSALGDARRGNPRRRFGNAPVRGPGGPPCGMPTAFLQDALGAEGDPGDVPGGAGSLPCWALSLVLPICRGRACGGWGGGEWRAELAFKDCISK